MVVSGNLPMSSAEIDSMMLSEVCLFEMALSSEARIPVTTMSPSTGSLASAAAA